MKGKNIKLNRGVVINGCLKTLAMDKVTMGEFADLIEECTGNRFIVDIRNRNENVLLKDIGTLQTYPARKIKRS